MLFSLNDEGDRTFSLTKDVEKGEVSPEVLAEQLRKEIPVAPRVLTLEPEKTVTTTRVVEVKESSTVSRLGPINANLEQELKQRLEQDAPQVIQVEEDEEDDFSVDMRFVTTEEDLKKNDACMFCGEKEKQMIRHTADELYLDLCADCIDFLAIRVFDMQDFLESEEFAVEDEALENIEILNSDGGSQMVQLTAEGAD